MYICFLWAFGINHFERDLFIEINCWNLYVLRDGYVEDWGTVNFCRFWQTNKIVLFSVRSISCYTDLHVLYKNAVNIGEQSLSHIISGRMSVLWHTGNIKIITQ